MFTFMNTKTEMIHSLDSLRCIQNALLSSSFFTHLKFLIYNMNNMYSKDYSI